jgi:hypothetical protein
MVFRGFRAIGFMVEYITLLFSLVEVAFLLYFFVVVFSNFCSRLIISVVII